jgi:hypothetical protein
MHCWQQPVNFTLNQLPEGRKQRHGPEKRTPHAVFMHIPMAVDPTSRVNTSSRCWLGLCSLHVSKLQLLQHGQPLQLPTEAGHVAWDAQLLQLKVCQLRTAGQLSQDSIQCT